MAKNHGFLLRWPVTLVAIAVLAGISVMPAAAQDDSGAVYVLTNQAANAVMVYARAADGALSFARSFSTGGKGAGTGADPLGSQGSLVLGRWHRLLFAVNPGSNDITVFEVEGRGLELRRLDQEPSGGTMPVSIAAHGSLVYVLNAGGAPNIQGFFIDPLGGRLVHLPGSRRVLPGGASSSAAEVAFSPHGDVLMVTEKGTNKIDTWTVNDDGFAENGKVTDSSGATPFGFAFTRGDFAIVSEAGPGALSSYEVDNDGTLEPETASLGDTQKAVCWVVTTRNGSYAFGANTASGSISSYLVSREGFLTLLNPVAASTGEGTAPIDMALSEDSHFLYVRVAVKGALDGFRVESDGSLTPVTSAKGVPAGAQGIAAR
ncbi:MAG: beta-propeller fold lactonase family protein [Acidobacteriota bacterium]|nr:beta-propeller fold lactonase family protein [Acidobacteriota bacterium]